MSQNILLIQDNSSDATAVREALINSPDGPFRVEWVKRCPSPHEGEAEIEIRQVFEAEDFGSELTPELRKQEERLRERLNPRK